MSSAQEKISLDDVIAFNGELAAIVRAGVPIELGLQGGRSQWKTSLARLGERLAVQMQTGTSLADAISSERSLPPVYRAIVIAGLRAGRLPQALEGISKFAELVRQMRQRLGLSLIYPGVVLVLTYVVWLVFLLQFVPEFVAMQVDSRRPQGPVLNLLSSLSQTCGSWWWIPPAAVVLGGLMLMWRDSRSASGGSMSPWGRWLGPLTILPGMRRVAQYYEIAGFSEIAGVLTAQQIPLPETLELAAGSLGDPAFRESTDVAIKKLRQGAPFEEAAAADSRFPPYLRWLIQIGISQQRLPASLSQASEYYRRKADSLAGWLQFVVPMTVLVGVCGAVVALYAVTVFVPFRELMLNLAVP